jgi:hypothetical protein
MMIAVVVDDGRGGIQIPSVCSLSMILSLVDVRRHDLRRSIGA